MRTKAPSLLPLFRSEMQLRMLGLLLLQPERRWTLQQLAGTLAAPQSSVHRELGRAEHAGIVVRDATARPHRFHAATDDPLHEPLAVLLRRSVGVEEELHRALAIPGVAAAAIHGSWATGRRRPDSDVDVFVVGDVPLRELRRVVRSVGKHAGRTIDVTVMSADELRDLAEQRASFARHLLEEPVIPLVGDLSSIIRHDESPHRQGPRRPDARPRPSRTGRAAARRR